MFGLVYYQDCVFHVCSAKNIIEYGKGLPVLAKFKNGARYLAELICYHEHKEVLIDLKKSLEDGTPSIVLSKIDNLVVKSNTDNTMESFSEDDDDDILDPDFVPNKENIFVNDKEDDEDILVPDFVPDKENIFANDKEDNDDILDPDFVPDEFFANDIDDESCTLKDNQNCYKNAVDMVKTGVAAEPTIFCNKTGTNYEVPIPSDKLKKSFCMYCKKLFSKLPRHLELIHSDQENVKKMMNLPKGCPERSSIINFLRRRGNYEYNQKYINTDGELIVCRRSMKNKKRYDYEYCSNCKGMFSKKTLHRHYRKCTNTLKGQRNVLIMGRTVHAKLHQSACETLKDKIFPVMREDHIVQNIRYDELIILYGNHLCKKYRSQHNYNMIRARLRLLGRLFVELKMLEKSICDYESVFNPHYYDKVIAAVNAVARLNTDGTKYEAPTSAFHLGTLLKQTGNILITECIKNENEQKKKQVEDFLKLLEVDFGTSVNKTVMENQLEMKRRKSSQLPSTDDIKKLCNYLANLRQRYYRRLSLKFCEETWKSLAQVTLTSVQVFNRRRAGEIERIKISDFENYQTVNDNTDHEIYNSLSIEMKQKAQTYVRFTIRGKLARGVPVLLHKDLVVCIKLILHYRAKARVSDDNPYVFGIAEKRNGIHAHLNACCLMRKYSSACGALSPHLLRGTELRKHIATQSVLLNLEDSEVSDLANFLGHAEKIHRDHYRLPVVSREITLMSSLLEKAQGNVPDEEQIEDETTLKVCNMEPSKSNLVVQTQRKSRSRSPMGFVKRISWNSPERHTAENIFKDNIENSVLPSLRYCAEIIASSSDLQNRTPNQLYAWVNNRIKNKSPSNRKKKRVVVTWRTPEKIAMKKAFQENINAGILPTLGKCAQVKAEYCDELKHRTPIVMKAWVNNIIKKNKNCTSANRKDLVEDSTQENN